MTAIEGTTPVDRGPISSRVLAGLARLGNFTTVRVEWRRRRRYREDLKRLLRAGPYLIVDIGLTPRKARREIAKPVWRP
jgi:uncharacterized protein YjiS (DUF1127 family)